MNPVRCFGGIHLTRLWTRTCNTSGSILAARYSQKAESVDTGTISDSDEYFGPDAVVNEEDIERKRNKSGLRPHHRNVLNDRVPYSEPMTWYHERVKYKQKMYGLYGKDSGVNAGIMWPTREEIEDLREYESVAYPATLQEMMENSVKIKLEKEKIAQQREEEIMKKLAKLEGWKEDLMARIRKKETAALEAKAKKDRLVEEVRQHFGYKVDPKDERFQEMLEKKERAERKLLKEAKRKEREAKALAKLAELGMKAGTSAAAAPPPPPPPPAPPEKQD